MTTKPVADDRLDEVLAEIERARSEPAWVPDDPSPRRLFRAPESLEHSRWEPSRQAVVLVALCALIAAAVFGVRMMLARDDVDDTMGAGTSASSPARVVGKPAADTIPAARTASGSASPSAAAAGLPGSTPATAPATWSVHVIGAVVRPGVVTVPAGARVADAVRAAGSLARGADSAGINLARQLADGEQIHIPRPGEHWTPAPDAAPAQAAVPAGSAGTPAVTPAAGARAAQTGGGTVNLNTADVATLDGLPGVGPVLAQRIVDWRTEHGRFSSVEELGEVSGIGDKAMERLRSKVTV